MGYLTLYIAGIAFILLISRVGWSEALKTILRVLIPSVLIILFNVKAGKLLYKSPVIGIVSLLPTAIFIFKGSQPLVSAINSWLDSITNDFAESPNVVDAEVISKEDI